MGAFLLTFVIETRHILFAKPPSEHLHGESYPHTNAEDSQVLAPATIKTSLFSEIPKSKITNDAKIQNDRRKTFAINKKPPYFTTLKSGTRQITKNRFEFDKQKNLEFAP